MAEVFLKRKGETIRILIDEDDLPLFHSRKWHVTTFNYVKSFVGQSNYKQKYIFLHREVMNAPPYLQVDHINLNRLDNRKQNLRLCTPGENARNHPPHKNSKVGKGVSRQKNRWIARIMVDGKSTYLGHFVCPVEAAVAYRDASKKLHGEFSRLQ